MRPTPAGLALFLFVILAPWKDGSAAEPVPVIRPLRPTCCDAVPATLCRSGESLLAFLLTGAPLASPEEEADADSETTPAESSPSAGRARTPGAETARLVEQSLRLWSEESSRLETMTPARLRRLTHEHRNRSGHEIDVLAAMQRPVSRDELRHRFHWSWASETDAGVVLSAVPRDAAERLFVPRIDITLSRKSGLPESVRFLTRTGGTSYDVAIAPRAPARPFEVDGAPVILQTAALQTERPLTRSVPNVLTSVQRQAFELVADGDPREPSPEVAHVLGKWEQASALAGPCEIAFRRYTYDLVFNIERRAEGKAVLVDAARVRIDIGIPSIAPGEVSRRRDSSGAVFRLEADKAEIWIWNGREVTHAQPAEMTCWEWKLPESVESRPASQWGDFRLETVLPFAGPVSRTDLARRFDISLPQRDGQSTRLTLKPREAADTARVREYEVILSAEWLPEALRTVDAAGTLETVHVLGRRTRAPDRPREFFAPHWDGWKREK